MTMKGQMALTWVLGMVAIFTIVVVYFMIIPVHTEIAAHMTNLSYNLSGGESVRAVIDNTRIGISMGLITLVAGIIIYMLVATQREEPHTDFAPY